LSCSLPAFGSYGLGSVRLIDNTFHGVKGVARGADVDTPVASDSEFNIVLDELVLSIKENEAIIRTRIDGSSIEFSQIYTEVKLDSI